MNKKYGFTLIEILIVMVIVGVVTTIGINTFKKHSTDNRYLYSNVYHSLDQAIYNAMNFTNLDSPFVDFDEQNKQQEVSQEEQITRLCTMLTSYITTPDENVNCTQGSIMPISATSEQFDAATPYFTALNGVRFYISQRFQAANGNQDGSGNNSDNGLEPHKFFIVFADVNGAKAPNSMHYQPGIDDPDIFAFAVLDIGRVCPLGPPEVDEKYLLTRIRYLNLNKDNRYSDFADVSFSEPSRPYYISKAEAWGVYLPNGRNSLCDASGNNCDPVPADFIIDDNPFTYNEYVRNIITEFARTNTQEQVSMIYDNVPQMTTALQNYEAETGETINLRKENDPDNRGYGCVKLSDEECQIIVDKYIY